MVNSRQLFNGSILAILRAGLTPGNITVTATCPGLKSATVKLKTLQK
jgi:beta-galactosidase